MRWSSFRATFGLEKCPSWVSVKWVLSQFDSNRVLARTRYHNFVVAGIQQNKNLPKIKEAFLLGSEQFLEKVKEYKIVDREIPIKQLSHLRPDLQKIIEDTKLTNKKERDHLIRKLYRNYRFKMIELAIAFKIHYTTVSKIVKEDENL